MLLLAKKGSMTTAIKKDRTSSLADIFRIESHGLQRTARQLRALVELARVRVARVRVARFCLWQVPAGGAFLTVYVSKVNRIWLTQFLRRELFHFAKEDRVRRRILSACVYRPGIVDIKAIGIIPREDPDVWRGTGYPW